MLSPAVDAVRLSFHVLAAALWVGGQYTLAGLVPALRAEEPDAVGLAARRFARMAWPAYLVLLATGVWNIIAMEPSRQSPAWRAVLWAKIAVVALSGIAAYAHQRAHTALGR